jgi:DNA-binding CsgD family transcriptional regulator
MSKLPEVGRRRRVHDHPAPVVRTPFQGDARSENPSSGRRQRRRAPSVVEMVIVDDIPGRYDFLLKRGGQLLGVEIRLKHYYTVNEFVAKPPLSRIDLIIHDMGGVLPQVSTDPSDPIAGTLGIGIARALHPTTPVAVISRLCEARVVGPVLQLGVQYYNQIDEVLNSSPSEFAGDLLQVLKGKLVLSPRAKIADTAWRDCRSGHTNRRQAVIATLRPQQELSELDARRFAGLLLRKMHDELAAALLRPAVQCDFLWRQHLQGDSHFSICTFAVTPSQALLATAHAELAPARKQLTKRQREVLALIREGKTHKEIATELLVSPRTVASHVANAINRDPDVVLPGARRKGMLFAEMALADRSIPTIPSRKIKIVHVPRVTLPIPGTPSEPTPRAA